MADSAARARTGTGQRAGDGPGQSSRPGSGVPDPGTQDGGFDDARWRSRMQQSDIADELFTPLDHGAWTDARFRVVRSEAARARTRITGVRFLAADPKAENLEPERQVQTDLRRLVDSLIKLRSEPEWGTLGLSGETFRTSRRFSSPPRRQFGLTLGPESDRDCARDAHAAIRRAIRRAGFVVVDPQQAFAPETGLEGLRDWADRVRLRRRQARWPWLLLLLPLLFLLPRCDEAPSMFGAPIETASFVLLIDRSSSMEPHFDALRAEAKRVLAEIADRGGACADIVSYCGDAQSCLGGILPVDAVNRPRLDRFLEELAPGGGTVLKNAIDLAAAEIRAHERPTTLIVLTDARDESIAGMVRARDATLAGFGGVTVRSLAFTPRLFGAERENDGGSQDPRAAGDAVDPSTPRDDGERRLRELAELLGGRFGAERGGS